jgi:hypothetical protein
VTHLTQVTPDEAAAVFEHHNRQPSDLLPFETYVTDLLVGSAGRKLAGRPASAPAAKQRAAMTVGTAPAAHLKMEWVHGYVGKHVNTASLFCKVCVAEISLLSTSDANPVASPHHGGAVVTLTQPSALRPTAVPQPRFEGSHRLI